MNEKRLEQLNDKYTGTFRHLTHEEVQHYSRLLNKRGGYWYQPYAMREEDKDIVCTYDTPTTYTDFLFISQSRF